MLKGIGIDIVELSRIEEANQKYGDRFLNRIYTEHELAYCNSREATKFKHLAARFAAKEVCSKAMGTGIARGVSWKDMEIQNLFSGEPIMKLYGKALEICQGLIIHVSLTHTNTNAAAVVVLEQL